MNTYQTQLSHLLKISTLTFGTYKPTLSVMTSDNAAVLLDNQPVYLSGPADCELSLKQAAQLACSEMFKLGLNAIGLHGQLSSGIVAGKDIKWKELHSAIVKSESGVVEDGHGTGALVGINLTENNSFATLMCINDSIAKILDPECPELDDGHKLSQLSAEQKTEPDYTQVIKAVKAADQQFTALHGCGAPYQEWDAALEEAVKDYNKMHDTNFDPIEVRHQYMEQQEKFLDSDAGKQYISELVDLHTKP
ncbi:hypothetical protein [Vibrio sp. TRT 29B02]|uniref:hypothetical protein n=1 Tax=Vibrio sp. TRT 29B02 TaxID=3418508 RepID=UPI003CE7B082